MTRKTRRALKVLAWGICLSPLGMLVYQFWTDDLGANPISYVTNVLGDTTLRVLLASLAMTPLRLMFGISWQVSFRRLLGLFAFAYAGLHFTVWLVLDHFFDWPEMGRDILKRPYITIGMLALATLVPLAATSTAGMIRRLGGTAWRRLHRLAYVAGVAAILHFLWLAKVGRTEPYYYAAWLGLVLGVRGWAALRRRLLPRARARPSPVEKVARLLPQ